MDTRFKITLRPEGRIPPIIHYGINSIDSTVILNKTIDLEFDVELLPGEHRFILDFNSKKNSTPDMAIIIEQIEFEGIVTDRMRWSGIYYPNYPEPWASTQTNLLPVINHATYLGWNGRWELPFTTPIFQWIHQIEHLGWIYS